MATSSTCAQRPLPAAVKYSHMSTPSKCSSWEQKSTKLKLSYHSSQAVIVLLCRRSAAFLSSGHDGARSFLYRHAQTLKPHTEKAVKLVFAAWCRPFKSAICVPQERLVCSFVPGSCAEEGHPRWIGLFGWLWRGCDLIVQPPGKMVTSRQGLDPAVVQLQVAPQGWVNESGGTSACEAAQLFPSIVNSGSSHEKSQHVVGVFLESPIC